MTVQNMRKAVESYLRDSYAELKRVAWPNRSTLTQHTLIVILFSVSIAIFLGALDVLYVFGIEKLILNK